EHRGVVDAGADERAQPVPSVDEREERGEKDAERDDEEAIDGIVAADDRHRAIESCWKRDGADLAARDEADDIDDHERDADREEDLIEVTSAQPPKQE